MVYLTIILLINFEIQVSLKTEYRQEGIRRILGSGHYSGKSGMHC